MTTLTQVHYQISLESKLTIPKFNKLKQMFLLFKEEIGIKVSDFSLFNKELEVIQRDKKLIAAYRKQILDIDYIDIVDQEISVPENFSGNLLDYVNCLNNINKTIIQDIDKTLEDYCNLLAMLVTDPNNLKSLQDHTLFYTKIENNRIGQQDKLNQFFPEITGESKSHLGEVIHSKKDLMSLIDTELSPNNSINDLGQLNRHLNKCSEYLSIIHDNLSNENELSISKENAMNLSEGAMTISKLLEFISSVNYHILVLNNIEHKLFKALTT